eukprot:2759857-Rhodomonas_salina.2
MSGTDIAYSGTVCLQLLSGTDTRWTRQCPVLTYAGLTNVRSGRPGETRTRSSQCGTRGAKPLLQKPLHPPLTPSGPSTLKLRYGVSSLTFGTALAVPGTALAYPARRQPTGLSSAASFFLDPITLDARC